MSDTIRDDLARDVKLMEELHGEVTVSACGFTVTVTHSAGEDGAVVIFVDGPDDAHEAELMPDGSPRCRILLNDEPVYAPVAYVPRAEA